MLHLFLNRARLFEGSVFVSGVLLLVVCVPQCVLLCV